MTPQQRQFVYRLVSAERAPSSAPINPQLAMNNLLLSLRAAESSQTVEETLGHWDFAIYGTPGKDLWEWSLSGPFGHFQQRLLGSQAAPPGFPAFVEDQKRSLDRLEAGALEFFLSLPPAQRQLAWVQDVPTLPKDFKPPPDHPALDSTVGLPAAQMTPEQRLDFVRLLHLQAYSQGRQQVDRLLDQIEKSDLEDARFTWYGSTNRMERHGYRITGPAGVSSSFGGAPSNAVPPRIPGRPQSPSQ
jgi:hypothetical protein